MIAFENLLYFTRFFTLYICIVQVANAFTLTVQHAQHTVRKNNFKLLRDHCKKIKEEDTFDKKLDGLTQKLLEDGKLGTSSYFV